MIWFGIVSRDQISRDVLRSRRPPAVSYALLDEFDHKLSSRDEATLAFIYDKLPAGAYHTGMRTWAQRYATIDDIFVDEIDKVFATDRHVAIHDMAVSNSITSLDLFERMKYRKNLTVNATEFFDTLYVVTIPGSRWRVIFDAERRPLQIVGKGMVLSVRNVERKRYPVNRLVKWMLIRGKLPHALRILHADAQQPENWVKRISLFHPRSMAMARRDPRFRLGRDNFFDPKDGSYEVIRILNAISSKRYSADRCMDIIRAVSMHLVDGGLFFIGKGNSKNDPTFEATIFQRQGNLFASLRDYSGGYEFKSQMLGLRLDSTPS